MANNGLLTTVDNPFDPFEQWTEWLSYDREQKHFTCELVAKISNVDFKDSDETKDQKIKEATDLILDFSPFHLIVYPKHVDGGEGS